MAQRILRPMNYGDILDETFDLYKKNFLLFAGIIGLVYLPLALISNYITMSMLGSVLGPLTQAGPNAPPPDPSIFMQSLLPMYGKLALLTLVVLPFQLMAMGAVTWAVSSCYLDNKPTILQSYKAVFSKLWPLIITSILTWFALAFGTMLCCVPGIVLFVLLGFVSEVIILEGKFYFDAFSRSFKLAVFDWVRVLVIGILSVILMWIASFILTLPIQMISTFSNASPFDVGFIGMLRGIMQGISSTITTPIVVIAFVLLYYDIRVRKEGFDIELLAASMGTPREITEPPVNPGQ